MEMKKIVNMVLKILCLINRRDEIERLSLSIYKKDGTTDVISLGRD